jgi:hypothetical protein
MTARKAVLLPLLLVPLMLSAQPRVPKNLKLLAPNTDIRFVMGNFSQALGVACTYCHEEGDYASDANPKKDVARKMIAMCGRLMQVSPAAPVYSLPNTTRWIATPAIRGM